MPKNSLRTGAAFDAGLATLAAISAGFVAFAMPEPIFSSLVAATPLPGLVAAAQPPLGETARLAAVGLAAVFAFAIVWALMRALDRKPRGIPNVEPAPAEIEPIRLRRADAHPDAPPPSPLMAARDLGEPEEIAPKEERVETARPLPSFLVPDPMTAERPEPEPLILEEPEPEPVAFVEPVAEVEPIALSELAARIPEPGPAEDDQSIGQLVGRIEFGMKKRQAIPAPPPSPEVPETEKVGHRLRSAISDLQKIAGNG
ncbi:MAG TPA: hypothetical protein VHM92_05610 [Allosphingosinicella sp.]|nr:hypothetical protein [Allosphingosinicella sp.]